MKSSNHFTPVLGATALLALLSVTSFAAEADKAKENPRPAQESRGVTTTGKDATKPAESDKETATSSGAARETGKPAAAADTSKTNPRPAQESRGVTTTGAEATKAAPTAEEKAQEDKVKAEKKAKKEQKAAEKKAEK